MENLIIYTSNKSDKWLSSFQSKNYPISILTVYSISLAFRCRTPLHERISEKGSFNLDEHKS